MIRRVALAGGVLAAGVWVLVASLFMSVSSDMADQAAAQAVTGCTLDIGGSTTVGSTPGVLDAEATKNVRAIIDTGEAEGVPEWGWVIAIATAMQETSGPDQLHDINYGDRDSLGLFQQRPSQGWGSPAELLDVQYAASAFYGGPMKPADDSNPGLLDITGWESMTLTQAAQAVQRSAFPDAYAQWQSQASAIVGDMIGAMPTCTGLTPISIPPGDLGTFITAVQSAVGKPYLWGGTGPDAFDCSGLIYWAWAQAGHSMADRTAAQMWADSSEIPAGQEQPGDLLYSEFNTRVSGPGHVAVIVAPGTAIEAPYHDHPVHEFTYTITSDMHIGRLSGSAFIGGFTTA